jgi:PIN domain nuclease of toxin-antitoxin system
VKAEHPRRRLLLDTQAFIDLRIGNPRFPARARKLLFDPRAEVFISQASVWEMAIKASNGKLELGLPLREVMQSALATGAIRLLAISIEHLYAVEELPRLHGDPFDRLLVCQARLEGLALVGSDEAFDRYGVERIW